MGCGHGYHGHGCWGPGDCHGDRWGWEPGYGAESRYGPGFGCRRRAAGRYGAVSRGAAAAQLEAYLATLRDEVRAAEADLAEIAGGEAEPTAAPQV